MKTYLGPGDTITVPATADVEAGDFVWITQDLIGIAANDAKTGEPVAAKLQGVFQVKKAPSQAWSVGDVIYLDIGEFVATKSIGFGNPMIGLAWGTVPDGADDTVGPLRIGWRWPIALAPAVATAGSAAEINALRLELVARNIMAAP